MSRALTRSEVVSSERDSLILVDADDRETGFLDKSACHDGDGVRHRAFSLFVFNSKGQLLLQRRAPGKRLWPDYWSNSCCSHPRQGEELQMAAQRRLDEELGLKAPLRFLYKFEYKARYADVGTEHELCSVFVGHTDDPPVVNDTEISEVRWIDPEELNVILEREPHRFTPWFRMEWQRLERDFKSALPL